MANFANGFAVGGVKFAVCHVHGGGEASAGLLGWTSYNVSGLDDTTRNIRGEIELTLLEFIIHNVGTIALHCIAQHTPKKQPNTTKSLSNIQV
jgi:hypothetical protein